MATTPSNAAGRPAAKAPSGAAGFEFGEAIDRAQAKCSDAGHEWRKQDGSDTDEVFVCSAPVADLGFEATVTVSSCKGRVCRLELVSIPKSSNSKAWLARYADLKQALSEKYGQPASNESVAPTDCVEADFVTCLNSERAHFKLTWSFAGSATIVATMGKGPQGDAAAAIRVLYTKPLRNAPKKSAL